MQPSEKAFSDILGLASHSSQAMDGLSPQAAAFKKSREQVSALREIAFDSDIRNAYQRNAEQQMSRSRSRTGETLIDVDGVSLSSSGFERDLSRSNPALHQQLSTLVEAFHSSNQALGALAPSLADKEREAFARAGGPYLEQYLQSKLESAAEASSSAPKSTRSANL